MLKNTIQKVGCQGVGNKKDPVRGLNFFIYTLSRACERSDIMSS